jgi:hypothetical protein
MSDIRACTTDDIPAVARLFQKAFRDPAAAAPPALESYLRELFLDHPWRDPQTASRVFVGADGRVRGFIGVLPMRMSFHGRPLRAALASSLVVDDPAKHPTAGARLLRSCLNGPQELCVSETSNPVALRMWERIGGEAIAQYSMEWLRPLQPAGLGVALLEEQLAAAKIARPLASLVDRAVARFAPTLAWPAPAARGYYSDADVDDDALIEHVPRFASHYALRPDWTRESLAWFLRHAASKGRYGKLCRRTVYDRSKTPVGCYLYYGRPRQIAWVLQILALPEAVDAVLANLLAHAESLGSVAVRGRTQPHLIDALLRNRCVLFQHASTTIYTNNADLLSAIRSGDAFIIGLAGEGWTRLIGETFT